MIQSKLGDAKSCFYEVIEPDDTFRCYLDIECDQEPSTDWIEAVLKLLKKDCVFGGYIKSADINEKYFENMLEPKADQDHWLSIHVIYPFDVNLQEFTKLKFLKLKKYEIDQPLIDKNVFTPTNSLKKLRHIFSDKDGKGKRVLNKKVLKFCCSENG